jgi:hypothetical protein
VAGGRARLAGARAVRWAVGQDNMETTRHIPHEGVSVQQEKLTVEVTDIRMGSYTPR